MLKKLLCLILTIFVLMNFASCGESIFENTNTDKKNTETVDNGKNTSDSETKSTQSTSSTDEPKSTEKDADPAAYIKLGGDKPYKIIYADKYSAQAQTLLKYLKSFDSSSTYTSSSDTVAEDGSPEILLGLTNREESVQARFALTNYLDYSISIAENKIIIFANTAEKLDDAVKYFVSVLKYDDNDALCYPSSEPYVKSYTKYTYSNLTINEEPIKNYSIVIPSKATQKEKDAAESLIEWIGLNTGYTLHTVLDSTEPTANEIIIGKANRSEASYDSNSDENRFHSAILKGKKLMFFAGNTGNYDSAIKAFADQVELSKGKLTELNIIEEKSDYNNKKAIFIGNSFIYWGGCVTHITNSASNEAIRAKGGDKGYFNEVCKANGINIDVYNYTYGGQNLDWIYNNKLKNMSESFLNDIDYVFISEAGQNSSGFKNTFTKVAGLFKNAEEIVYLAHENTFASKANYIINALPTLAKQGYKIVAWGELVYDVYKGNVKVPNATKTYNKNTFIKNATNSEKMSENAAVISISGYGDDFHQNPLSGYITAQMCFSAITGASAIGQAYDFCGDKTIAPQYDLENFLTYQYGKGQTSNFIEVFNSKPDMLGLQTLMDQYMKKYN